MGIEPFLVASALHLVVAQRLVRRLCPGCRRAASESERDATRSDLFPNGEDWVAEGCADCSGTGYVGRSAIFETLQIDKPVQEAILARSDAEAIRRIAKASGGRDLRDDGLSRIHLGETSWMEVLRETV